jgi:hypothetical protein
VADYFSYQAERQQQRKDAPKPTAAPAPAPQPPAAPASIEVQEFDPASTTIVQRFRHALAKKFRDE